MMRVALALALLSGAWALLSSGSLASAQAPRVYAWARADDPALERDAREIAALARAALAESEGFSFREADRVVRGRVEAAQAAEARARLDLRRGRQAYLRFELESAIAALESALAGWDEAARVIDNPEPLAETLMYLGACHVLRGDQASAERMFARYHVAFAELVPDPRVFNPEIMEQWQRAGRAVLSVPSGRLRVQVNAPSGEVSVDGWVRGVGSLTLDNVTPGEHAVRVSVVGGDGFFARVMVKARETSAVETGTLQDSAALVDIFEHAREADGAHVLARQLQVDALAVIEVTAGPSAGQLQLTLHAFNGASGREQASFERTAGADLPARSQSVRGLVAAWLDAVAKAAHAQAQTQRALVGVGGPASGSGASALDDASLSRPLHKRWWVWAIAGAVVVAGGVTALVLTRRDGGEAAPPKSDTGTLVLEF